MKQKQFNKIGEYFMNLLWPEHGKDDNFDDKESFDAYMESKENPTTSAQSIEEERHDLRN